MKCEKGQSFVLILSLWVPETYSSMKVKMFSEKWRMELSHNVQTVGGDRSSCAG